MRILLLPVLLLTLIYTTGFAAPPNTAPTNQQMLNDRTLGFVPDTNPYWANLPFITVTTSPYIGLNTAFDASDVLYWATSMNEDLMFLQERQSVEHELQSHGHSLSQRPILEISGGVEGQIVQTTGYFDASGDISLSALKLDFNAMASPWASAFAALAFDDSPLDITGTRVPNSRIYLDRGFLNIGNLDVTPIYMTLGQFYVPFGRYANNLLSTPVTMSMARTLDRALQIGYWKGGFNFSTYVFTGSQISGSDTFMKQGGVNASYKQVFAADKNITIGAGWISNLADSQGMQDNGGTVGFTGFAFGQGNDLVHKVPAVDVHTEVNMGPWFFYGEYIACTSPFAEADMTFNGEGAQPKATHAEIGRYVDFWGQKVNFSLGMDHTWEALALNLPSQSFEFVVNTSFWKNTVEAIEFRHDIDYSSADVAIGNLILPPTIGSGQSRDTVIAQIGVYF